MISFEQIDKMIADYEANLPNHKTGSLDWHWLLAAITTLEKLKREAIATPAKK